MHAEYQQNIENLEHTWEEYKFGYGDLSTDSPFWGGLEYMHWLSTQREYQLRVRLVATDFQELDITYAFFRVSSEAEGYTLEVGDLLGSTIDIFGMLSATPVNKEPFSTHDRHADKYSVPFDVHQMRAGWWYPSHDFELVYGFPEPCFLHLTHNPPWYCSEDGPIYIDSVTLMIKPNDKA